MEGYQFVTSIENMDFSVIHQFIGSSYWAAGIPEATLRKALSNSMCFGVLTDRGEQVAFARMITDKATFAYLADVFVIDSYRGKGISKWLMNHIMEHPDLQGLRRIMLATRDAHGLYSQYGFEAIDEPASLMQIRDAEVYQRAKMAGEQGR